MKRTLHFLMILGFVGLVLGKRIELLRLNKGQTIASDDFIPVYSALDDFPASYAEPINEAADLVLLPPNSKAANKGVELKNYARISNRNENQISNYEPVLEGRNFQPLPLNNFEKLTNYKALPTPELANFHLPEIATSALKNLRSAPNAQNNEADGSSGRTFKHFLLMKSLLGGNNCGGSCGCGNNCGSGGGSGGGGLGAGGYGGVLIIQTPVNVTNMNNNTLSNTPAAAAAAAGGAAGAAGAGEDAGLRINYIGVPQTQAYPMQSFQMPAQVYQQPTPVYQQRQAYQPMSYSIAMFNIPGTTSYMPISMPIQQQQMQQQHQYQSLMNRHSSADNVDNGEGGNGDAVERRHILGWSSASSKNHNPWSAFANNLRGLQFL